MSPFTDVRHASRSPDIGRLLGVLDEKGVAYVLVGSLAAQGLKRRATRRACDGSHVPVAHIDDLIARLTIPRREKDIPCAARLREIQRRP